MRKILLTPASWLYGLAVGTRNMMFDIGLLKSHSFDVPVVVVGNIAVGGTGKTPHVEYLIDMLRHTYHIGMLSRGYRRATKGFVLATSHSCPRDIGDEPYQIYRKFGPDVTVAVCEDRVKGIEQMLQIDPAINLLILDDAFQHRYVRGKVNILLTDYSQPYFDDQLLPLGRLREGPKAIRRADIIVATKCPVNIQPKDYMVFRKYVQRQEWQRLFYSSIIYQPLRPLWPEEAPEAPALDILTRRDIVYLVAGIANPRPLLRYLKTYSGARVQYTLFRDHREFTRADFDVILQRWHRLKGDTRIIVTTEKDAVRMVNSPYFPHELKPYLYYQPIQIFVQDGKAQEFEETVRKLINQKS